MIKIHIKWLKLAFAHHNYWFWENWEKIFKNFSDFGGGDRPSNRFFEFCSTLRNFLWLDSDKPSLSLQFAPYDGLWVLMSKRILRNSQFGNTKSANSQDLILLNHLKVLSCHIVTVYFVTKGMKCWHLTRLISATNEKYFWELSISNCFEIHLRLPHLTNNAFNRLD